MPTLRNQLHALMSAYAECISEVAATTSQFHQGVDFAAREFARLASQQGLLDQDEWLSRAGVMATNKAADAPTDLSEMGYEKPELTDEEQAEATKLAFQVAARAHATLGDPDK